MSLHKLLITAVLCMAASPCLAFENEPAVKVVPVENVKVMLTAEGELKGVALLDNKTPIVDAKISLTAKGKVIDSVKTDKDGNFSFTNVAPGAYQMLGSADGYVGSQSFDVAPFAAGSSCPSCSLGMNSVSSNVAYDSYAQAPLGSFSSSCGGGGIGGGGIGGGRILGSRLGRLGLIGGIVAIAVSGDDDASPDR